MADIANRNRRQRVLNRQLGREGRISKKPARYGSKLHHERISEGILKNLYGKPHTGKYRKHKQPKRVAGTKTPARNDLLSYYKRVGKNKRKRYAR